LLQITGYKSLLLILLLSFSASAFSQSGFRFEEGKRKSVIDFRLIRNLIVVKMYINNKGPFNFIMDTGVGFMLITDPSLIDTLHIVNKRTIKVSGLGNMAPIEADVVSPLLVTLPKISGENISAAVLREDYLGLSSYAGIHIHGLLGYDFFKSFLVRFNFGDSTMVVYHNNASAILRKGYKIPISIENNKPYLIAKTTLPDGHSIFAKLIVDIGAGHPLSLENPNEKITLPKHFINANLGIGLTGPIEGLIGRIPFIEIGKYKLHEVLTSFPHPNTSSQLSTSVNRDGNIGLGILKKFTILFNYDANLMYIKPNAYFREPFEHDMSGMEYYAGGDNFDHFIISRIEPGSPADEAGLEVNDEITSINFKPTRLMSIEDIDDLFKSKNNRTILIGFFRNNKYSKVILNLKKRI
jgi:hypothetical protein